jgi:isochorismate synthase
MDYIEELLFRYQISDYDRKGPFTAQAGNIVHLKTRYKISLKQLKGKIGKLIADLHPTPAVCGLPRNKSYELIRKTEKHDRSFYAGFLGPWNISGESKLFVNLRCAAIYNKKMNLYIGGGLTAESKVESEWEETVRKSQTLLSVLEKM